MHVKSNGAINLDKVSAYSLLHKVMRFGLFGKLTVAIINLIHVPFDILFVVYFDFQFFGTFIVFKEYLQTISLLLFFSGKPGNAASRQFRRSCRAPLLTN